MLYKYVCIIQNLANFLITPLGNLVNEAVVANGNLLDDWSRAELITHIVQHYITRKVHMTCSHYTAVTEQILRAYPQEDKVTNFNIKLIHTIFIYIIFFPAFILQ